VLHDIGARGLKQIRQLLLAQPVTRRRKTSPVTASLCVALELIPREVLQAVALTSVQVTPMHPQCHFATSNHFSFFFSDFATPMQLAKLLNPETESWGETGGISAILCSARYLRLFALYLGL
jgi:hypothetical protein